MALLARGEIMEAESKLLELENTIVIALTPRDDVDDRGIVLEVRAGTGNLPNKPFDIQRTTTIMYLLLNVYH